MFEGLAKDPMRRLNWRPPGDHLLAVPRTRLRGIDGGRYLGLDVYAHRENKTYGNIAYTNMSEQMAKILRMGANDQSVIDRLNWMRDVQGPMLRDAMKIIGEIDLRLMLAQALHMGDECHNRNNAGTTLLIQALTPGIIQAGYSVEQQREVFEFVASSDYFSGPTWMAMCKAAMDAAHGIEYSTVVTTMARNGVEFGLRVSGLPGQWFYRPSAASHRPDVCWL